MSVVVIRRISVLSTLFLRRQGLEVVNMDHRAMELILQGSSKVDNWPLKKRNSKRVQNALKLALFEREEFPNLHSDYLALDTGFSHTIRVSMRNSEGAATANPCIVTDTSAVKGAFVPKFKPMFPIIPKLCYLVSETLSFLQK